MAEAPLNLDEDLLERVRAGSLWAYRSWEPDRVAVILGRGNLAALEVAEQACHADHVPVLRRRGGGGAVVLAPGMLVISCAKTVQHQFYIKEYFGQINAYLIEALQSLGIRHLRQQGHSDLCIRDRKILGASMYRSKNLLFYTAALLVSNDLTLIPRYLKHPSQEPEYRRGRPHLEFLTTLALEYSGVSVEMVKTSVDTFFLQRIPALA